MICAQTRHNLFSSGNTNRHILGDEQLSLQTRAARRLQAACMEGATSNAVTVFADTPSTHTELLNTGWSRRDFSMARNIIRLHALLTRCRLQSSHGDQ